ncbi:MULTISPECIES: hypothetical protein [Streptomyces]|uniref:Large membrane protein n=1 Tax=Streptomyces rimosus subsp. rimosus TaxID=132474 RepID=A0ABY3Z818_STRRM|nr:MULTISPECIES: hypothetical protein [Streptomyces]KOG76152.1 hypothetical protein ADK78_11115 [Kitasatospora aureofaciens]KEF07721.1 hypothetical protein DF17_09225 [Streptomyces rimosus]KEF20269.1 hypothetical protein DF18_11455 [Streptomyces rimosus]KUJ41596.1 hypothetical protein ADK46_06545 [Streptomyces rimosus subsp. rimosus]UNZ06438.1 hypothetical protein SRIMR7_30230 [Streptomyces rimosus subsp. rimosus]
MSTEDTSPASGGEHSTDDTQETTARRRRSPLIAASVAAAVLLAGGGAAYWASTASGGGDSGAGARPEGGPPPLALDGYATGKGTGSHSGIAPGEPDPSGSGYRATGKLPDGPSSAPVYQPRGQVSQEAVARLAKALDLPGQVRSDGDSWKVGGLTRDARSPVLQVAKSGSGAWTYSQYGTPNGTGCAESGKGSDSSQASGPGCRTGDESGEKGAVSPEKAKQAAQPVLAALGQKDAKLDASGLSGAVRTVSANPVIGGLPTYGWQSDIQVGSDGQVVGGSGQLAQPVKGDTYPVQSAEKTLERLNATHGGANSGIGGCATAEPQKQDKAGGQDVEPCVGNASARKPADVTGAVFGLSMQYVGGRPALVPSWLYTVQRAGGGTVTHPAVDPKYVKKGDGGTSAQPPDSGKPSGKAGAMSLESYSLGADGKSLKLHFWGGVCSVYSATVEQTGKSVKAEVIGKDKKPNQICVKMAKEFTQTVPLDKPLAGRDVIDASSGKEVPAK